MGVTVRLLVATDLHQQGVLYRGLAEQVARVSPDALVLGGDFLHGTGLLPYGQRPWLSVRQCAQELAALPVLKIFVRGNHEDHNWLDFAAAWPGDQPLEQLNGEVGAIGPLRFIGFPCSMGDPLPFSGSQRDDLSGVHPQFWLRPQFDWLGPAGRVLWLMHEPPTGTRLTVPGTVTEGHPWWREIIEQHQPRLVISGHDHLTPLRTGCWHDHIGRTLVVNAGQNMDGPLQSVLVEARFARKDDPLPAALHVTRLADGEIAAA